jgi:DNA polymerase (family X)
MKIAGCCSSISNFQFSIFFNLQYFPLSPQPSVLCPHSCPFDLDPSGRYLSRVSDSHHHEEELAIDNAEVARVLQQIADMLEFKNENPFKFRSYQMAAETIGSMGTPVTDIVSRGGAGELQKIPGIGKTISTQILEIVQTGESSYFEELTRDVPATVLDLRRVSGIGLKTAQLLYRDFGINSLEQLKSFAEGGGLASVPGLGEKSVARVKASLTRLSEK